MHRPGTPAFHASLIVAALLGGCGLGASAEGGATADIQGRASLAGGAPAAGAKVAVRGGGASATAEADGSFTLKGVPLGFHEVTLTSGAYEEVVPLAVTEDGARLVDAALWPMLPIELPRAHRLTASAAALEAQPGATCDPVVAPGMGHVLHCDYDYGDGTQAYSLSPLPTGTAIPVTSRTYTGRGAFAWSADGLKLFIADGWNVAEGYSKRLLEVTPASGTSRVAWEEVAGLSRLYAIDGMLPDGTRPVFNGNVTLAKSGGGTVHLQAASCTTDSSGPGYAAEAWFEGNGRQIVSYLASAVALSANDTTACVASYFREWRTASATKGFALGDWPSWQDYGKIRLYDAVTNTSTEVLDKATGFGATCPGWILARALPAAGTEPTRLVALSRLTGAAAQITNGALREQVVAAGTRVLFWEGSTGAPTATLKLYDLAGGTTATVATEVPVDQPVLEQGGYLLGLQGWGGSPSLFARRIDSGATGTFTSIGATVRLVGFSPGTTRAVWLDPWDPDTQTGTLKLAPVGGGATVTVNGGASAAARGTPRDDGSVSVPSAVWSTGDDAVAFEALAWDGTAGAMVPSVCVSERGGGCSLNSSELLPTTPGHLVFVAPWYEGSSEQRLLFCHFGFADCEMGGENATYPMVLPGGAEVLYFRDFDPLSQAGELMIAAVPAPGGSVTSDALGGQCDWEHARGFSPSDIAVSPDGTRAVIGGRTANICLVDVPAHHANEAAKRGSWFVSSDFGWLFSIDTATGLLRADRTRADEWSTQPTVMLATGVPAAFTFDGADFTADRSHVVVPTESSDAGAMATVVDTVDPSATRIMRATSWRFSADPDGSGELLLLKRLETPAPFSFQDGLYAAQLP